jgi:hypothetical protein
MPTTAHQTQQQRVEDIRRRRLAMARRDKGLPPGLARELWADVGYLLNALERAERAADVASPALIAPAAH